jgi:hypothetical protein
MKRSERNLGIESDETMELFFPSLTDEAAGDAYDK